MFMSGTTEQWVGLLEYFILIFVLLTGTFALSCIIYNKFLHKKIKNNSNVNKLEKKSYFIDVA